jgi:4-hydroxyproline epimerase
MDEAQATNVRPLRSRREGYVSAVAIVDSHTAGEPTRVVLAGGPDLGSGTLQQRLATFREHFDHFRSAVVDEPRGSSVLVGAMLCEPLDPRCVTGVIFFNNVAYLGMCGHGTIGVIATLAHLGRISPGDHWVETPVGVVGAHLHHDGRVTVRNVPSYRYLQDVRINVPASGTIVGDIAWGGNWFFLVEDHGQEISPANVEQLTAFASQVRRALDRDAVAAAAGELIDHIELFAPSTGGANSRNFVLCPGGAYDRSPCGTGTSAKIACLAADGKLAPGETWVQESIIGSRFEASYTIEGGHVLPSITGSAFVTLEGTLVFDERDPLCYGLRAI